MKKEFLRFAPIAEALTALLHPYAEVVIHDFKTGKIGGIYHNFSNRAVGDESLVDEVCPYPDTFTPYYKTNWDGRRLKSTTATIRDDKGDAIGLFCINIDISGLDQVKQMIALFTETAGEGALPSELFKEDWREKISFYVHRYLQEKGLTISTLKKEERQHLIEELFEVGAFKAKHSADFVASVLDVSRATIYQHLKLIKRKIP